MFHSVKKLRYMRYMSYRLPMPVKEAICYKYESTYPICPRCKTPLEREYQNYCDRCGQSLNWKNYANDLIKINY
ncbi:MAG: hypothetical protein ACOX7J_08980 [Bacillota bacterium]|jgi:predicted amidophosphoribosyltransferase